jgi:hypothetical protein
MPKTSDFFFEILKIKFMGRFYKKYFGIHVEYCDFKTKQSTTESISEIQCYKLAILILIIFFLVKILNFSKY